MIYHFLVESITDGTNQKHFQSHTLQLAHGQPSMIQLEQDYQANDCSINVKTLNPNFYQVMNSVELLLDLFYNPCHPSWQSVWKPCTQATISTTRHSCFLCCSL